MTKQEFYAICRRMGSEGLDFAADGVHQVLKNPSQHASFLTGYLIIGVATFLIFALAGHRATRQGPTIAAAILLAWPIPWLGVFLHACWTAVAYFFWQMWRD